jgi:pimeloyl-ACP methyl ester carboxylesterase
LDLHLLLQNAGIAPPYIMVGHSLGGLNTRVYNGMFPHDLAGAVLVDAAHENEPRRAPAFMLGHSAPRILWRPIWIAAEAARVCGLIRLLAPRPKLPDDPAKRTRRDVVVALRLQPKTLATMADASTPDSYAQAEASGGFGNLPLTVLTRGKFLVSPHPTAMEREQQAYEQVWMHEIQPKLANLSTRGRQIIVETSGHDIPEEAPDVIVEAIREQLAVLQSQAGARSSSGPR